MHSDGSYTRNRKADAEPGAVEADGTFVTLCNDATESLVQVTQKIAPDIEQSKDDKVDQVKSTSKASTKAKSSSKKSPVSKKKASKKSTTKKPSRTKKSSRSTKRRET